MASAKCRLSCRALSAILLCGTLLGLADPADASVSPAQIAASAGQVVTLELTIAAQERQSMVLDAQYLAAQARVQQLESELATTEQDLNTIKTKIRSDKLSLAHDAVTAYVFDQPVGGVDSMFDSSPESSIVRTQYANAAFGNIVAAERRLGAQQQQLASVSSQEQAEHQQASQAAALVQTLALQNEQAAQNAQATLAQVQGTLAQQVAQYAVQRAQAQAELATSHPDQAASAAQAAEDDAAVAIALQETQAAAAAAAAANQAAAVGGAPTVAEGILGTLGPGIGAVGAAESQLGVPYVWGGESPGQGFDCSGLTQWSWRQAGIPIPRTAAQQAAAVPHVPLDQLEPGDLLFYYNLDGDDQIDHVVMYVGSGPYGAQTIIQAPYTGATVQFAPLFTEGLVAAGRP